MSSEREIRMIDIKDADLVSIETSADGSKLWINVEGVCRLRSYNHSSLTLDDRPLFPALEAATHPKGK